MKTLSLSLLAAAALVAGLIFSSSNAGAQAVPAAPKVKKLVDVNKVNVEIQKTPQFNVPNVKDKRFTPKDWLEIEVDCKAELDADAKKKNPDQKAYPEVVFKYYAYLDAGNIKKNRVLTGEVTHVNVPINEVIHSVMYISPSTILGITDGKPVNPTMIKASGVEVFIGGELVGRKTSEAGNKEWWKEIQTPQEAALLDKTKTPFAPLWYDYHMEVRAK